MPAPVQIEPPWVFDLDRDALVGTCCKHFLNVDVIAGPSQQAGL